MAIAFVEVRSEQVPVADTTHYTVTTGTTAEITQATVCNESTASQTISFYIPNPTAAAGVTNQVISSKTILAGQTDLLPELLGKRLSAGSVIKTTASDGASLNLHMSLMIRS